MNIEKFTLKAQEALQEAKSIAERKHHQQIDVEHLLSALLGQKEGIVIPILQKLGANPDLISFSIRRGVKPDSPGDRERGRAGVSLQSAQ